MPVEYYGSYNGVTIYSDEVLEYNKVIIGRKSKYLNDYDIDLNIIKTFTKIKENYVITQWVEKQEEILRTFIIINKDKIDNVTWNKIYSYINNKYK